MYAVSWFAALVLVVFQVVEPARDVELYPSVPGEVRRYDVTEYLKYGPHKLGTRTITTLAPRTIDGVVTSPRRFERWLSHWPPSEVLTSFMFTAKDKAGYYIVATQSETGLEPVVPGATSRQYLLKFPLEVGTTWHRQYHDPEGRFPDVGTKLTVEAVGETVVVPAGRFDDCTKVVGVIDLPGNAGTKSVSGEWYCRGVGLVSSTHSTESGVTTRNWVTRVELVEYTRPSP